MREKELRELINYRMQRAMETLEEARVMAGMEHWNACANRLYYAAFYAVSALLVKDGLSARKHSGIKAFQSALCESGEGAEREGASLQSFV